MRLITWNINGIRTLPQFHPWCTLKTFDAIFNELGGDIICVQETKITLDKIDKGMACMETFDSFFSCYKRTPPKGYSGTAIFTRKSSLVPRAAEEGLSDELHPPSTPADNLIGGYPSVDELSYSSEELRELDLEGRTTIVDCNLFVLINVYCPNQTNDQRLEYKNAFNALLEQRVRNLIAMGRQVIVVGDINVCAEAIDHVDPGKRASEDGLDDFNQHPSRKWFRNLISQDSGILIDICRRYQPEREKMFTCWNTKIDARASNYGARIDYILVTPGLLPWISYSDIQADVRGSDHCPVYVDFHDSITDPSTGKRLELWQQLNPGRSKSEQTPPVPPKLAACHMDEFSGKQKLLSAFFGRKQQQQQQENDLKHEQASSAPTLSPMATAMMSNNSQASSQTSNPTIQDAKTALANIVNFPSSNSQIISSQASSTSTVERSPFESKSEQDKKSQVPASTSGKEKPKENQRRSSTNSKKSTNRFNNGSKEQLQGKGQSNIAAFFSKGPSSTSASSSDKHSSKKMKRQESNSSSNIVMIDDDSDTANGSNDEKSQNREYTKEQDSDSDFIIPKFNTESTKSAWSNIMAKRAPPKCTVHNEDAKELTVNKPGPNKGRKFWMCARNVGAKDDPEAKCDFFKWSTEVKRPYYVSEQAKRKLNS